MADKMMKAAAIHAYGPAENLTLHQLPIPEPAEGQMLVKVYAASVNPVDTYVRSGRMRVVTGNNFPLIPGRDIAGVVEKVRGDGAIFKPGDKVYGTVEASKGGGYAEYAVMSPGRAGLMPGNISFVEAASVPVAGVTALQCLRLALADPVGREILIYGATGGVGVFAVQAAKAMGMKVTAVCNSKNTDVAKKAGAGEIMEYDAGDFLKTKKRYDAALDLVGNRKPGEFLKILARGGLCISTVFRPAGMLSGLFNRRYKTMHMDLKTEDLDWFRELIEKGDIKPIIDTVFPLEQAAEAHKHVETKHSRGKVVLKIREEI